MSLSDLAGLFQSTRDPAVMQAIQQEMLRRQNTGQNISPTFGNQPSPAPNPGSAPLGAMPSLPSYGGRSSPAAMPTYDQRMDQATMPGSSVMPQPAAAGAYGIAAQAPPQPGPMDASIMSGPGSPGPGLYPPGDRRYGMSGDQLAREASEQHAAEQFALGQDQPPGDASDLPMPAEKPPAPDQSATAAEGRMGTPELAKLTASAGTPTRGKRVRAAAPGPSESDILNKLSLGANHGLSEQQQIAQLLVQRLAANS